VFTGWAGVPEYLHDFFLTVVERMYSFLAQRFMSFQE
jgi:hypothetical protein